MADGTTARRTNTQVSPVIRWTRVQGRSRVSVLRSPGERVESDQRHCRSARSERDIQVVSPITLGGCDRVAAYDDGQDTYLSTIVLAARARSKPEPEAELLDFRSALRLEAGRRRE